MGFRISIVVRLLSSTKSPGIFMSALLVCILPIGDVDEQLGKQGCGTSHVLSLETVLMCELRVSSEDG